ncbi:MAG: hypothetical protein JSV68_05055, partial [Anaerolineaceae bacterium]
APATAAVRDRAETLIRLIEVLQIVSPTFAPSSNHSKATGIIYKRILSVLKNCQLASELA